jgi:hypothetical protein
MKGDGYNYIGKEKSFEEYYNQAYGTANSDWVVGRKNNQESR